MNRNVIFLLLDVLFGTGFLGLTGICICLNINHQNPEIRELEDEEQIRAIKEYRKQRNTNGISDFK